MYVGSRNYIDLLSSAAQLPGDAATNVRRTARALRLSGLGDTLPPWYPEARDYLSKLTPPQWDAMRVGTRGIPPYSPNEIVNGVWSVTLPSGKKLWAWRSTYAQGADGRTMVNSGARPDAYLLNLPWAWKKTVETANPNFSQAALTQYQQYNSGKTPPGYPVYNPATTPLYNPYAGAGGGSSGGGAPIAVLAQQAANLPAQQAATARLYPRIVQPIAYANSTVDLSAPYVQDQGTLYAPPATWISENPPGNVGTSHIDTGFQVKQYAVPLAVAGAILTAGALTAAGVIGGSGAAAGGAAATGAGAVAPGAAAIAPGAEAVASGATGGLLTAGGAGVTEAAGTAAAVGGGAAAAGGGAAATGGGLFSAGTASSLVAAGKTALSVASAIKSAQTLLTGAKNAQENAALYQAQGQPALADQQLMIASDYQQKAQSLADQFGFALQAKTLGVPNWALLGVVGVLLVVGMSRGKRATH